MQLDELLPALGGPTYFAKREPLTGPQCRALEFQNVPCDSRHILGQAQPLNHLTMREPASGRNRHFRNKLDTVPLSETTDAKPIEGSTLARTSSAVVRSSDSELLEQLVAVTHRIGGPSVEGFPCESLATLAKAVAGPWDACGTGLPGGGGLDGRAIVILLSGGAQ